MKEATARRLTLAGLVACALIACAAAESDTRFLGSSNLARIHEIDDVREELGAASGPSVGTNEGELFSASELTKKKDAGTDAGGDAPALRKKHRDRIKKEKCEPRKRPLEDRCEYVRTHPACETDDNLVHYLRLHYCTFGPAHQTRSHLTQAILVVLLCSVLANVAEHFFCPALSNVAGWLALPEDVAGATLLSFGNGAPDVFTQIAALHNASAQGISLGIGAALGASFFVASAVFPIVALAAPARTDEARSGSADAGGSDFEEESFEDESFSRRPSEGELLSQSFGSTGEDYFFIPRCPACVANAVRALKHNMSTGGVIVDPLPFFRDGVFYFIAVAAIFGTLLRGSVSFPEACAMCAVYVVYLIAVLLPGRIGWWTGMNRGELSERRPGFATPPEEFTTRLLNDEFDAAHPDSPLIEGDPAPLDDVDVESIDGTHEPGFGARLLGVLRMPLLLVLKCTMPECGEPLSRQSRLATAALPITAPLFFACVARYLGRGLVTMPGVWFGVACGSVGSAAVYLAWPAVIADRSVSDHAMKALTVITFVQSVTWMDAAAGELVPLFGAIGRICGVSESLLGATVFAWGISVGDLVSDVTVARRGMAHAAVSACFGGPLFNLLVGLAGSMVFATASRGVIEGIRLENEIILLAVCQLMAVTYIVVGIPFVHRGKVTRGAAAGLLGFYALSQVLIALTSGRVIFQTPWM